MVKKFVLLLAIGTLAMAGCGAKETATPPAASTSSTAAGATTPGRVAGSSVAPGTTQKAGCKTDLKLVNAEGVKEASLTNRALTVETAWADQGPHPDNTVDQDKVLELMITEFVVAKDPQFGYSIPVGVPTVPAAKVYLGFRLTNPTSKIAAGQTYVGTTSTEKAEGTANEYLYFGSARLLPGDPTIKITEITDDIVCATLSTATKTSLQSFVGIEGTFKATRIQSLEAKEKKAKK